ncbi:hypothetical protein D4T97_001880 [Siminovitchia acidinfaciens]|uniref:Uncharacterized protein n=1 Tax=Siminovitchia acidinfaciens TaxID=2321395 RepID=A0A429Y729_9BACI|nr:hypothetical protein D4T97_001880 [Siminovitchia acidinfaciens]
MADVVSPNKRRLAAAAYMSGKSSASENGGLFLTLRQRKRKHRRKELEMASKKKVSLDTETVAK